MVEPGKTTESPLTSPARTLASASSLMGLGRDVRMMPEDFKIGPLGTGTSGPPESDAAFAAASGFLAGVVAGSIERRWITPDAQDTLSDTFSYALQRGSAPKSFRIGVPKDVAGGQIAANVRFFGTVGTSEGEIYMARAGSQWLVADVQANLADLDVPPAPSKERFFPSEYRWLLEE